jgi:hypothetical protein
MSRDAVVLQRKNGPRMRPPLDYCAESKSVHSHFNVLLPSETLSQRDQSIVCADNAA